MLGCHLMDSEFDLWPEFCAYFCANILKISSLPNIPSPRFKSCLLTTILMSNRISVGVFPQEWILQPFLGEQMQSGQHWPHLLILEIIQPVWVFIDLYLETGMCL